MGRYQIIFTGGLLVFCGGLLGGCTSDDAAAETDTDAPYGAWDALTQTVHEGSYGLTNPDAKMKQGLVAKNDRTFNGTSTDRFRVGFVNDPNTEVSDIPDTFDDIWATVEGSVITVFGTQGNGLTSAIIPVLADQSGKELIFDEPIEVDPEDMAVGETRSTTVGATLGGTTPVTVNLTYTAVEDNVAADTARGKVYGCRRYHATATATDAWLPSLLQNIPIEGDAWYHPDLGVVAVDIPLLNISSGMSQQTDYGTDAEEGDNAIKMTKVLNDWDTSFDLSTYDRKGEFDADKNTHALMLVELRYANDADATTLDAPNGMINPLVMGTAWGYFLDSSWGGEVLTESPVSIFHPEENGLGFRYWYAFVDQAAKNETGGNGILYHISMNKDPDVPPIRVTARIDYHILPPDERN